MADEKVFVKGLIAKKPNENAPDFIKCGISIKTEELIPFLEEHTKPDGWLNIDIKESTGGKYYAQLNHWTKEAKHEAPKDEITPEDSPF